MRLIWCVAAALPLLLARAALPGLAEPSEARYGQICREMAEGGDWLVPRWQGIPHLEKPPLAYWAGAGGLRILGRTEIAVRLGALLALVASAVWAAGVARRVGGPGAAAPAALGMLLSPLTVTAGAACLTDPFLLAATTLFFHAVVRRLHDRDDRALDAAALALGLGFLAKGQMILLFTVVPLALARTGVFKELWRLQRVAILLALAVPWPLYIETRFPGFLRYQVGAIGGRAAGSGHDAPFFVYLLALAGGLFPFALYAPRGAGAVALPYRRLLLLWLLVPLVVLSAAGSRLWTYILTAAPPVLLLAAARLGGSPAPASGRPKWVLAVAGAASVAAWIAGKPAAAADALPFARDLGVALLLGAGWLALARRRTRTVAVAGLSAILVAAIVEGACVHETLFRAHRSFARKVRDLSEETGAPVVVLGMSLPSIAFYGDAPVTIAGEGGRLAIEAETWGESPLFQPEADIAKILETDRESVLVVKERVLKTLAPDREPRILEGGLAAVQGAGTVRPVR
ncbi:MAG TPA: glycosyltransferase family 39 protein [Planctomycetota bacterium]|nr:glycosyltransferase family 39 protein [Planctomycetota bacterium]